QSSAPPVKPCPGPPAIKNNGSGCGCAACDGTTTTFSAIFRPARFSRFSNTSTVRQLACRLPIVHGDKPRAVAGFVPRHPITNKTSAATYVALRRALAFIGRPDSLVKNGRAIVCVRAKGARALRGRL